VPWPHGRCGSVAGAPTVGQIDRAMRRLWSAERRVTPEREAAYAAAWAQLAHAAAAAGRRAWRFRSAEDPQRFVEFVETSAPGDPWADAALAAARAALDDLAPARWKAWTEA